MRQGAGYFPAFLPPPALRSGACVSTEPANFFAASVADFCCKTLPARLANCFDDCSFLGTTDSFQCELNKHMEGHTGSSSVNKGDR